MFITLKDNCRGLLEGKNCMSLSEHSGVWKLQEEYFSWSGIYKIRILTKGSLILRQAFGIRRHLIL